MGWFAFPRRISGSALVPGVTVPELLFLLHRSRTQYSSATLTVMAEPFKHKPHKKIQAGTVGFSTASKNNPNLRHVSFNMLAADKSMSQLSSIPGAQVEFYPSHIQANLLNILHSLVSRSVQVLQLFSLEVRKHKNRIRILWLHLHFLWKARLGNRLNGLH